MKWALVRCRRCNHRVVKCLSVRLRWPVKGGKILDA